MDSRMIPVDKIKEIIANNQNPEKEFQNFVLQGGAGSGKTETLKQVIEFIDKNYPDKKVVCITHTNIAVEEIKSRVGDKYEVTTIHSFLNSSIKNYRKNTKSIIHKVFDLEKIESKNHDDYKKKYLKYSDKLFTIKSEKYPKVEVKKEYDKNPEEYNQILNKNIKELNKEILQLIEAKDFNGIKYNETRFNNFENLTFGHDSLIDVAYFLFEKFELLGKIISDKYDFILIDEYQDTNKKIIEIFLSNLPKNTKTTVGLFGDSMQGIYDDGIGDVKDKILDGKLVKIDKEDNYRCSQDVINFINKIRTDGIEQKVALKKDKNNNLEDVSLREGSVCLVYSIIEKKPNTFSSADEKTAYLTKLNLVIAGIENQKDFKILMLTNKSISKELGFETLYKIYDDRYTEVKEEIEKDFKRLQLMDLLELCEAYYGETKNYNLILSNLKKSGFVLNSVKDKIHVKEIFNKIIDSESSAIDTLEFAFNEKIIVKSEQYNEYLSKRNSFIEDLKIDIDYLKLEKLYSAGHNTAVRMAKEDDISEEEFNEFDKKRRKKNFYNDLFSDKLKFSEIVNYYKYLNEKTNYITMHKTKGSGIENVLVVLDEFFWNKYNFKTIFDETETDSEKREKNKKLFYVACSRAIKNLICVRFVQDEEEEKQLIKFFEGHEIRKITI